MNTSYRTIPKEYTSLSKVEIGCSLSHSSGCRHSGAIQRIVPAPGFEIPGHGPDMKDRPKSMIDALPAESIKMLS